MTRNLLVILFSMPLAFGAGCEDTDNGNGDEDELDADTDADSDSDTDADADFSASIVATIPFKGVGVFVSDDSGAIVKDAAFCEGMTCTYQVPETGRYDVEAEDTFTFVPKSVNVDKAGVFQVSWDEGGCASDPEWAADGPCGEWVPGEYGKVTFEGERDCVDEIWGREAEDVKFVISDETIKIVELVTYDLTMSGEAFYGSNSSGGWYAGVVTEDGFHLYGNNTAEDVEYLFHCDD